MIETWVQRACKGDREALAQLYRQFSKAMFNICIRMTGNIADAEDVLQDSFLLAFRQMHQLKNEHQFAGWLKKIVVNECIRFSKRQFNWQELMEENQVIDQSEQEWWKECSLNSLNQAIRELPDGCRQVFNLYAVEDVSHKEIAQLLNITESTSKSQYHRARELLRKKITRAVMLHG